MCFLVYILNLCPLLPYNSSGAIVMPSTTTAYHHESTALHEAMKLGGDKRTMSGFGEHNLVSTIARRFNNVCLVLLLDDGLEFGGVLHTTPPLQHKSGTPVCPPWHRMIFHAPPACSPVLIPHHIAHPKNDM